MNAMNLNTNLWYVKIYFWCLDVWDEFRDGCSNRERTNLCQFIRTYVYAPVAIFANIATWGYVAYVMLYYPLTRFGMVGTVSGYLTVLLVVLVVWHWTKLAEKSSSSVRPKRIRANEDPRFIDLCWTFVVSVKSNLCPLITFVHPKEEEA